MVAAGDEDRDRGAVVGHHGLEDGAAGLGGPLGLLDPASDAPAVERLLDRAAAGLEARRLAVPIAVEPGTIRQW